MNNLVSIVIPTKNEEKNIRNLLFAISLVFVGRRQYETIVIDDGDDKTKAIALELGAVVIFGRHKGLGQAILDGIEKSQGSIVVVMDADLSHLPSVIPDLVKAIVHDGYDMAIGSRYIKGGKTEGWEFTRRIVSRVACLLALPITSVKDATSGFFCFRKSLIDGVKLEPSSWKTMLEILLKTKPIRVTEVPITFVVRKEGKSKFNRKQVIAYIRHLVLLTVYKYQKLLKFGIAEGIGTLIVFALVWLITERWGLWYITSLAIATIIGFFFKYVANTLWTFKVNEDPKSANYEWNSFYKGSLLQKWWKRSIAKTIWQWMPNASSLLDIGCGSSPIITNYHGKDIWGIDTNQGKLDFMKTKCPEHKFVNTDIMSFKKEQFDHVLCIEVLEHLNNPEQTIKEMTWVVKNGGQVIIATPDYSKWLWRMAEKFTPYKEEHIYQFTKEKLEEMCKRHGLKPVRHKYIAGCDLCEEFIKVA